MRRPASRLSSRITQVFFVPGTCFATAEQSAIFEQTDTATIDTGTRRDEGMRQLYATHALAAVGRLLGAVDRNPYHKTYGCLDRQFWHYRTADFPSEMYQEGALPLALAFTDDVPGNRWFQSQRVRELAVAAIDFAVKSSHADCSCDDYYPFERALGAAVFSLAAATRAYQLLGLDDVRTVEWFCRRANWIVSHDESGRLANHHALAALGLLRVGEISGRDKYIRAAEERIATVLDWQHRGRLVRRIRRRRSRLSNRNDRLAGQNTSSNSQCRPSTSLCGGPWRLPANFCIPTIATPASTDRVARTTSTHTAWNCSLRTIRPRRPTPPIWPTGFSPRWPQAKRPVSTMIGSSRIRRATSSRPITTGRRKARPTQTLRKTTRAAKNVLRIFQGRRYLCGAKNGGRPWFQLLAGAYSSIFGRRATALQTPG